jgi:hypothetical protein
MHAYIHVYIHADDADTAKKDDDETFADAITKDKQVCMYAFQKLISDCLCTKYAQLYFMTYVCMYVCVLLIHRSDVCMYACMHVCVLIRCSSVCIHAYMHAHAAVYSRKCHSQLLIMHACMHVCMLAYIHTCICSAQNDDTCIHTYIYIYIYIYICMCIDIYLHVY